MSCVKSIASLLVAAATLVFADVVAAPVKLLGLDDMSCTAWMNSRTDPEQQVPYIQWVRGFLSGHNYASQAKQVSAVSNGTISMYIDRYCKLKPMSTVAEAAMRMSDEYSGRNSAITK